MMAAPIAIVGAGLAGVTAADALRSAFYAGEILLFNEELEQPYDRPPLSKAYAAGTMSETDIRLRPDTWCADQNITHLMGVRAARIDPAARQIIASDGAAYGYEKLLLATGAKPRCLPGLDAAHPNVLLLRDLADARKLRARLQPGAKILLAGGGVIGMECAATAIAAGCAVTVLEGAPRIMGRFLAPRLADNVAARHRAAGVDLRTGFMIAGITVSDRGVAVTGTQGERVEGDLVLVGIGAAPDIALAEAAGLAIKSGGIAVDHTGRTSDAHIFAAGDCAAFADETLQHVRLENWTHAVQHARHAAHAMCGATAAYMPVPWVWSDQYDMNIQVTGAAMSHSLILRGALADGRFTALHLDERGRLAGATTINNGRDKRALEKLVAARACLSPAQWADIKTPLKEFLSLLPPEAAHAA